MIARAVTEHKEKNEIIHQLEIEIDRLKDIERKYDELDLKYEETLCQKKCFEKENLELLDRIKEIEIECSDMLASRNDLKKENSEFQMELTELRPRLELVTDEYNNFKKDTICKIQH